MEYFYPQCNRIYRAANGIDIIIRNELDKGKMGIYKIWFGDKTYIGSTKNMGRRKGWHVNTINRLMRNMQTGEASNHKILKHLFINLDITCGEMELIHEVSTEEELAKIEAMYLEGIDNDENSLNYSRLATRPNYSKVKTPNPIAIAIADSLLNSINECVFRLYCNEKYVVIKGKSLAGSIKSVSTSLDNFSKKDRTEWPIEHLYYHFIGYILSQAEEVEYSAQLLAMTPNRYDLLKAEQTQLWESASDPNCLNNSFDAYIPVYNEETGMYGWINRGQYAAFMKWKSLNMPQPQEPANCVPLIHIGSLYPEAVTLYQKDTSWLPSQFCHQQTQKTAFCQQISWPSSFRQAV